MAKTSNRPPRYISRAVADVVKDEAAADLAAALATALIEHVASAPRADREHLYHQIVNAVFDRQMAEWLGPGGKLERRLRELSALE